MSDHANQDLPSSPQRHPYGSGGTAGAASHTRWGAKFVFWMIGMAVVGAVAYQVLNSAGPGRDGPSEDFNAGLTESESHLATVFLVGEWVERDLILDDAGNWTGSGVIVAEEGPSLIVMTNSHCLGVEDILKNQFETVDIAKFALAIATSQSNTLRKVTQFAKCKHKGLDVALIRIPREGLRRGVDYAVAPIFNRRVAKRGVDVVAIGAPRGLRGTETFGRVSALREPGELSPHPLIQTDAALNQGNSGGPLYAVIAGKRQLVGLNTFGYRDSQGLNFAFFADEYHANDWMWFDANPAGAVAALKAIHGIHAEVAK
jgi:S1-C subfamily serine protease